MKKNLFAILLLFGMLMATESFAQRGRNYRYRYAPQPRMRVYVAPRLFAPPAIGFGWNRGGVFIAPPPLMLGRGLGWRHYHRRGGRCNDRCCRRTNEFRNNYDRRYDDRRRQDDNRYDNRRRYEDRYDDRRDRNNDDRYDRRNDNRGSSNQNRKDQPESINTDEDIYEEVEIDIDNTY